MCDKHIFVELIGAPGRKWVFCGERLVFQKCGAFLSVLFVDTHCAYCCVVLPPTYSDRNRGINETQEETEIETETETQTKTETETEIEIETETETDTETETETDTDTETLTHKSNEIQRQTQRKRQRQVHRQR